jgi:glycosyltransferase
VALKISVVTVCLNSERTIAHAIDSFVRQTYPNKELIVVDGCSTDRTLEIVKSFGCEQIRICSEADRGIYDAMNKGLGLYAGDAVGFLNSDDAFHDITVLESIAAGLEKADAVYGDIRFVADQTSKRVVRRWSAGPYRHGSFRNGWLPPHPTFYIRRDLAQRTGAFDLSYGSAADYDYMLRALELHEPRVCYIPRVLVDFMQGGRSSGSFSGYISANLQCLKSRRRHLNAPAVDRALILKPLRKLHQFRAWS